MEPIADRRAIAVSRRWTKRVRSEPHEDLARPVGGGPDLRIRRIEQRRHVDPSERLLQGLAEFSSALSAALLGSP